MFIFDTNFFLEQLEIITLFILEEQFFKNSLRSA